MFSMRIIFHPSRLTHFESPNTNSNHDPLIAVVCHYLSSKTVNIQSHSSKNLTSVQMFDCITGRNQSEELRNQSDGDLLNGD